MKKITSLYTIISLIIVMSITSSCAIVTLGAASGALLMSGDRRLAGEIVDDQLLEYQVSEAIYAELRNKADVSITAYNGVALLTGEANSQTTIKKITDLVSLYARNNIEIVNEIVIGQPTSFSKSASDTILTAKVKSILLSEIAKKQAENAKDNNINYTVLTFSVKVVTHRSVVYLLGILTKPEQQFVKNVVSRVKGVSKVVSVFQDWDRLKENQRKRIGKLRDKQAKKIDNPNPKAKTKSTSF